MKHVTIDDIKRRMKSLKRMNENSSASNISAFSRGAYTTIKNGKVDDIKKVLESAVNNSQEFPATLYVDLFDSVLENGKIQDVRYAGNLLESAPVKVRDGKALNTLLRRRIGRVKSKSSLKNKDNPQDVLTASLPKPPSPSVAVSSESVAINVYEETMKNMELYEHCDRVLNNYDSISKRFNIDSLIYENTKINDTSDTVITLCSMIDTYDMPDYIKFNTVIETALYGFETNNIDYKKSDILESAIDYFLFKEGGLESCKKILDNTVFFDKDEDMGNIDIITEEEPETEEELTVEGSIKEFCVGNRKRYRRSLNESTEFSDLFKKFKENEIAGAEKPESKLRQLITKLYSRNVDSIVEGTPNLLAWIRSFFIVGSCSIPVIGPFLMIINFLADKFISLHFERQETEKMIKCFDNEIKKSKDKMNQDSTSNEDKENLKKYIDSLKNAKKKIEDYYDGLLTDEETEERYNNMDYDDFDLSDFDTDGENGDLFNDDSDLFESALCNIAECTDKIITNANNHKITDADMYMLPSTDSDHGSIVYIATVASKFPDIFYKDSLSDGIAMEIKNINSSTPNRYTRMDDLKTAASILDKEKPVEKVIDIKEAYEYLDIVSEAYEAISMIIEGTDKSNPENLLESSVSNKLKMASMKLRNLMTKMSDKDKQISRSVDLGMNNFKKGVERALTNDNRESIIKGTILPSASKVIKMAIVNAGLIAIGQPVLAIIGTLGYLGVSKRFKAKERQALTDEIEIELKMCQKYIDIAEQKNDMKALKQLLMIQRDLERQHQRIKYKMRADLGQKYYDAKSSED